MGFFSYFPCKMVGTGWLLKIKPEDALFSGYSLSRFWWLFLLTFRLSFETGYRKCKHQNVINKQNSKPKSFFLARQLNVTKPVRRFVLWPQCCRPKKICLTNDFAFKYIYTSYRITYVTVRWLHSLPINIKTVIFWVTLIFPEWTTSR